MLDNNEINKLMAVEVDKINLLMLEHFYGGKWVFEDEEEPEAVPYLEWDTGIFYPKLYDKFGRFSCGTPSPTTDMNQAMECWEATPEIIMELHRVYRMNQYFCSVKINNKHFETLRYSSAPLVICKALLKAKGIEIE